MTTAKHKSSSRYGRDVRRKSNAPARGGTAQRRQLAPLRPGDVVDVVAPGWACDREVLDSGLEWLRSLGLKPRVPRRIFARDTIASNTDEARAHQLGEALGAPDSAAIWCVRGGYGSIRLLPSLARMKRPPRPKLLVGLSDVSTVLMFLDQEWGWPSMHGPLLDRFGRKLVLPRWEREIRELVFGERDAIEHAGLLPMNAHARKAGRVQGPVAGGNLITLQSSLGTPWQWRGDGRILFFEEIGERGYRVDRALEHMRQAGVFRRAKAVVFGDFTGGDEPSGENRVRGVLQRFADEANFPVLRGLKTGHAQVQRPVMVGASAVLETGARGRLVQAGLWAERAE